ncbi:hypothetical protein BGX38DRAFT_539253 [Terfezia claveryi]|nr:hypothetical protein BGX38DRAFT_539253 [Terfezia claveryi]
MRASAACFFVPTMKFRNPKTETTNTKLHKISRTIRGALFPAKILVHELVGNIIKELHQRECQLLK